MPARKLVFWYDDHGDFATLELTGAKLYRLAPDNQFQTKYFLERLAMEQLKKKGSVGLTVASCKRWRM